MNAALKHRDELTLELASRIVWSRRGVFLTTTLVGLSLSVAFAFSRPTLYTARSTFIPIDAAGERLGSDLGPGGSLGVLSGKALSQGGTVIDKLVALLKSRTIAENTIHRHALLPQLLESPDGPVTDACRFAAEDALRRALKVETDGKAGFVTVQVQHPTPQGAAFIANALVAELGAFIRENTFSAVKRKRKFLEEKVAVVSKDLAGMEKALIAFQEEHQIMAPEAQIQAAVQSYNHLKALVADKQMQLQLLEDSVSGRDVQLIGLRREVSLIESALSSLESGRSSGFTAFKDIPRLQVNLGKLQREIATKQKVLELLTEQLELAKIEEVKDAFSFQVLDRAVPPSKPDGHGPGPLLLLGLIGSVFLGGLVALGLGAAGHSGAQPETEKAEPCARPR